MDSNSDNISNEYIYGPLLKELSTIRSQFKEMNERIIKTRIDCLLKSVELSNKIESFDSVNELENNLRKCNEIETNSEFEVKSKIESKVESKVEPKVESKFESKVEPKVESVVKSEFEENPIPEIKQNSLEDKTVVEVIQISDD